MQYVQNHSLPPYLNGPEDKNEVKKLTEIEPVRPVSERTHPSQALPPPTTRPEHQYNPVKPLEKRNADASLGERRKVCRRIQTQPLLIELRSKLDRRHKKQRNTDITEHINEKA